MTHELTLPNTRTHAHAHTHRGSLQGQEKLAGAAQLLAGMTGGMREKGEMGQPVQTTLWHALALPSFDANPLHSSTATPHSRLPPPPSHT